MMNLYELSAKLSLDSSGYETGLGVAEQSLNLFEGALKTFVAGYAVKKFIGLAEDAVNVGMAFDSAMSRVAATMGTTTDEIQDLRNFAMEMGATTAFSANEAAQALNYMALAGYDADKSMAMLPTVLDLAASGGFSLARASDMVTDAESALGLTTEETAAMVDQMARTASRSNTSVEQLGDAMLTIGGTAKFMAGGTDRLQTVLGLLADNGIKGSEAGTHLRNMLLKLSSPTEDGALAMEELGLNVFDASGNMRDMQDIIMDMNHAMDGLTDQQKIDYISKMFNTRDIAAVNALLGTTEERWNQLGSTIAEASGSAKQMAGTQLGNLTGDITIMKSALEGVKIQFSDGITPAIKDVVQRITDVLSNPKTQKFLRDVGEALGNVIKRITEIVSNVVLPKLISLFDNGAAKLKLFGGIALGLVGTIKTVTTVMGLLAGTVSPAGLLIKGLGLLVGVIAAVNLAEEDYIANKRYLTEEDKELIDSINDLAAAHQESINAYNDSITATMTEKQRVEELWKELQTLTDEEGNVKQGMEERASFILGELNNALGTEYTINGSIIEQYKDMQTEIDNLIAKRAAESLLAAKEALYNEALQNREKALRQAGDAYDKLAAAQAEYAEQQERHADAERTMQELRRLGYDEESLAMWNARDARDAAEEQMEKLQLQIGEYSSAYTKANEDAKSYYSDIERYENAQMEIFRGNYKEAEGILTKDFDYSLEIQRKKALQNEEEEAKYKAMLAEKKSAIEQYRRNMVAGEEGFHSDMLNKMIQTYNAEVEEARKAGLNIGTSLGIGIAGSQANVNEVASNLVRGAINRMRAEAQIASPSKKGRAIGENIGESLALGLDDTYADAIKSAENLSGGVLDAMDADYSVNGSVSGSSASSFEGVVVGILRDIRDNIGSDIVLNDGTLVGRIDKLLGQTAMRKARGNA